jgi:hypothetical protein
MWALFPAERLFSFGQWQKSYLGSAVASVPVRRANASTAILSSI